jgi:magnesium-transporting ATPase (P-type)
MYMLAISFSRGPEFRRRCIQSDGSINYAVFKTIAPQLRVLARCSPTDKYNLVKGLMKMGLWGWCAGDIDMII